MKVRLLDGDTEYFDIVAGVLQGDTLTSCFFIICLDYVLRTSIDKIKENGFELRKKRSRRYPTKTITDADFADDKVTPANAPVFVGYQHYWSLTLRLFSVISGHSLVGGTLRLSRCAVSVFYNSNGMGYEVVVVVVVIVLMLIVIDSEIVLRCVRKINFRIKVCEKRKYIFLHSNNDYGLT